MKNLLILIFVLSHGYILSQKKYPENNAPKNIKEAIEYMDNNWTEEEKESFKDKDEFGAASELHFGYGMWLRNSWLRYGNPKLPKYFHKRKVFSIDNMSSIILTVFHRKLNKKKWKLNEIFKPYKVKWRNGKESRKKYSDSIKNVFENFKVNDTISWKYYTTVIGVSPEEIEKYGNCKPKAVILKKRKKDTSFLVKLITCCNEKAIEVGVYGEKFRTETIEINKTGWTSYWEWKTE
jgi:hypothetical protein